MNPEPEAQNPAGRRWADRIADLLVSGPAVGAVLAIAAFVLGALSLDRLSYFGHQSDELKELAIQIYGLKVAAEQAKVLALYLAVGLGLGLISSGYLALRDHLRGQVPTSRLLRAGRHVLLLSGLHLAVLAHSVIVFPQLYSEFFFDRGGARRTIQVWLTDWVSPGLLVGVVVAGLALYLVYPVLRRLPRTLAERTWRAALGRRPALAHLGVLGLLAAAVTAAVLASAPDPAPRNRGPNLVILAVDSLRPDRLELPEHRGAAPRLRALADRSTTFGNAYATLARTFPSWATLLTGREPHDHGIRHMFPSWESRRRIGPNLVRHLAAAGYRTAVVSDYAGEIFSRADLGFHHVDVSTFSFYEIIRQRVLKAHLHLLPYLAMPFGRALAPPMRGLPENADSRFLSGRVNRMIDRLAQGDRFLLVAFYSSAHFPYAAPYPFYKRFTSAAYRGPYRYQKQNILGEKTPGEADVRQTRRLFDGGVAAADDALAMVLDHLEAKGLRGRTIIVVTADHGENLYEADLGLGHGDHLRGDVANRVPFILHDPVHRPAPRRVEALTRDVDLAPTLAALVGHPMKGVSGQDLGPLIRGEAAPALQDRAAFMETGLWFTDEVSGVGRDLRIPYPPVLGGLVTLDQKRGGDLVLNPEYERLVVAAKHRAIRTRDWKLVYVPLPDRVRWFLYDVRRDPHCVTDVSARHPEVVRSLQARLTAWMRGEPGSIEVGPYVLPGPEPQ